MMMREKEGGPTWPNIVERDKFIAWHDEYTKTHVYSGYSLAEAAWLAGRAQRDLDELELKP